MAFTDLPADWSADPITASDRLPDVLDLFVQRKDRVPTTITVLLCDGRDRLLQPIAIDGLDKRAALDPDAHHARVDGLTSIVRAVVAAADGIHVADGEPGVLLIIGRPTGLSLRTVDSSWASAFNDVILGAPVRSLGTHLITHEGSREVPAAPLAA